MYYYRRKTSPLKWIIIILILIILGSLIYWFYVNYFSKIDFGSQTDESEHEDVPELAQTLLVSFSFIQGDVAIDKAGKDDDQGYIPAVEDNILHQGDKIKTGAGSLAVLNLENGSIIRLGQNSELILNNLIKDNIIIQQNRGRSYYNLKPVGNLQIQSLSAQIENPGQKFELITNLEADFVAALSFSGQPVIKINDQHGLVLARRIDNNQKALLDFKKDVDNRLKIEEFKPDNLAREDWYKWNFELDEKIGQPIEEEDVEQEDKEPEFSITDQSLELSAEIKESGVFLSWSIYHADDFKNYKVVRSKINDNLKYPDDSEIKSSLSQGLNSYLDQSIESGQKYYYRVCVIKINDKIVCGNVATAEIEEKQEEEEEEIDTAAPAAPNLTISISVSGVNLNWNDNTEEDFKQYIVLRSVSVASPSYPTDKFSTTTNNQFTDNSVNITSVGTYYYRVCSFDQADNYACSNVKKIEDGQIK